MHLDLDQARRLEASPLQLRCPLLQHDGIFLLV
jgi:hypothetical protein